MHILIFIEYNNIKQGNNSKYNNNNILNKKGLICMNRAVWLIIIRFKYESIIISSNEPCREDVADLIKLELNKKDNKNVEVIFNKKLTDWEYSFKVIDNGRESEVNVNIEENELIEFNNGMPNNV